MIPACVSDYRELARRRLPRLLFDYIDGGSYAETTLRRNVDDFETIALRQRVLRDVSTISLATELFGQPMSMPVGLGPVGMAGMYARRGEVQAARAAKAAGVPFTLSTVGVCDLAEVVGGAGVAPWFQLYMIRDRGYMQTLLETARDLGCPVLVFTVDLPAPGARYRDMRTGLFGGKPPLSASIGRVLDGLSHPAWLWDVQIRGKPHTFGNIAPAIPEAKGTADFWPWVVRNFDPSLTWKDLDWIRQHWNGPIVIKGVLDPEDAKDAVKAGADGIVVSNHGGRQLDGVLSGVRALPPIVDAVGDDLTVLMDGGVRSGLDVVKALALGARGVLLGRAWAWALGARGQAGVAHMLQIVRQEMQMAMALTGCTDVREAGRSLLTG
jgi:L-lactate dehydrogenase (cytochrome)